MRRVLLAVLSLLLLPSVAPAQEVIDNCFDCTLGIWDELTLVHAYGTIDLFTPKEIFVGIKLSPGHQGVTLLEFSIAGLPSLSDMFVTVDGVDPIATSDGSIYAPADTSSVGNPAAADGFVVSWASCLGGNRALLRLSILALTPVPVNTVFTVKRRYPSTYLELDGVTPRVRTPLFVGCNAPVFTPVRVTGGCYVANPDTNPVPGCQTAVTEESWTQVKGLFR